MTLANRESGESLQATHHQMAEEPGQIFKIGDLAREFDVTLRTLRFYEDKGLLSPDRSGTTRLYSEKDRSRLKTIVFCKAIGLSLVEIRTVLELQSDGEEIAGDRKRIRDIFARRLIALQEQVSETQTAIAELQARLNDIDEAMKS